MNENHQVYLDNASTTAVDSRVMEAMAPYFEQLYANPSSVHRFGGRVRQDIEEARQKVADILGAKPREVFFTGCGTESDNLALRGVSLARRKQAREIITTPIEHHAVLRTCEQLAQLFDLSVTYLPIDRYGRVDPDDVAQAISDDTAMVSIMMANNEIGTIEPIAEIARITRARGVPFHTDAVQAGGQLPLDVTDLGVDLLSLSGHKFHAPKGIGVLYVREGTPILPMQTGGGQEDGLRAGTENVPYIVGLARALELAYESFDSRTDQVRRMRDRLIHETLTRVPDSMLTGHPTDRLGNNASFVFEGVDGEALLLHLSLAGISASTGSACASGEEGASHVLLALGLEERLARGSLRLTLSHHNTDKDIDLVLSALPGIVAKLRELSPLYTATRS